MKKILALATIFAMITLLALPSVSSVTPPPDAKVLMLGAGTTQFSIGSVTAWIEDTDVYVQYQTSDGWQLTAVHVIAVTALDQIPISNLGCRCPVFGDFPYIEEFASPVTEHTAILPLGIDWQPGQTIYIMAHAAVVNNQDQGETAFGNETDFGSTRFSYYFTLNIPQDEEPDDSDLGDDDDSGLGDDDDDSGLGDDDDSDTGDDDDSGIGGVFDPDDDDLDDDSGVGGVFHPQLPQTGSSIVWLTPLGLMITAMGAAIAKARRQ